MPTPDHKSISLLEFSENFSDSRKTDHFLEKDLIGLLLLFTVRLKMRNYDRIQQKVPKQDSSS